MAFSMNPHAIVPVQSPDRCDASINERIGQTSRLSRRRCPDCGGAEFTRIRRRPIDRLLSKFTALQRIHCDNAICQWEGNVRVASRAHSTRWHEVSAA